MKYITLVKSHNQFGPAFEVTGFMSVSAKGIQFDGYVPGCKIKSVPVGYTYAGEEYIGVVVTPSLPPGAVITEWDPCDAVVVDLPSAEEINKDLQAWADEVGVPVSAWHCPRCEG